MQPAWHPCCLFRACRAAGTTTSSDPAGIPQQPDGTGSPDVRARPSPVDRKRLRGRRAEVNAGRTDQCTPEGGTPVKRIRDVLVSLALGMLCSTVLIPTPPVEARAEYVIPLFMLYPSATRLATCGTCHTDFTDDSPRNPYGAAFEGAGGQSNQSAALLAIEDLDSDGDGTTNVAEITTGAGFMPGYDCTNYTTTINAPADLADYVDPNDVGCTGSVTTTTVSGATTTTTTTTLPPGELCGAMPLTICRLAGKVAFQVKDKSGDSKDQVKWTWQNGEEFTADYIGDPLATTSYALCVYDRSAGVPSLSMSMIVAPNGGWKSKGSKGWSYKDAAGTFAGIQKLQLKAGGAGTTKAQVKAHGANIPMPLPYSAEQFFANDQGITVQLVNSNGTCWTSELTNAKKNTPQLFKAN